MRLIAALIVSMLLTTGAAAQLSRARLASIEASPPPDARLDLNLAAPDISGKTRTIGAILDGRPALLSFVDYTCETLCGTDLQLVATAVRRTHLNTEDYRILVFGIDPKDRPRDAQAMERNEIPPDLRGAATFLLPDQATTSRATEALGFRYAVDVANDQIAHPAMVYVVAPDGAIRDVLSPFALTTVDLAAVLSGAASSGLSARLRMLCYGFDMATGLYTVRIGNILRLGAAVTVVLLGASVLLLVWLPTRAR